MHKILVLTLQILISGELIVSQLNLNHFIPFNHDYLIGEKIIIKNIDDQMYKGNFIFDNIPSSWLSVILATLFLESLRRIIVKLNTKKKFKEYRKKFENLLKDDQLVDAESIAIKMQDLKYIEQNKKSFALAKMNQGIVYNDMSKYNNRNFYCNKAKACYLDAYDHIKPRMLYSISFNISKFFKIKNSKCRILVAILNNLGHFYLGLARIKEEERNTIKANEYFKEANKYSKYLYKSESRISELGSLLTAFQLKDEILANDQLKQKVSDLENYIEKIESDKDQKLKAKLLINAAVCYDDISKKSPDDQKNKYSQKAIDYYLKALEFLTIEKDPFHYSMIKCNLAKTFFELYQLTRDENYYDLSYKAINNAIEIADVNFIPYSRSDSLHFLSQLLLIKAETQTNKRSSESMLWEAKKCIDEAFTIENPTDSPIMWGLLKMTEAQIFLRMTFAKDNDYFLTYALKSINSALEIFNSKEYPSYNASCNSIKNNITETKHY